MEYFIPLQLIQMCSHKAVEVHFSFVPQRAALVNDNSQSF
jgi:hypothetical protein